MNADHINPFLSSTTAVFSSMLAMGIRRQKPYMRSESSPQYEVTGIIGLNGKAIGTVAVSFPEEMAKAITERLVGERPTGIDRSVVDAVGEVTNMIAGAAKGKLEQYEMSVGLPTVVIGKSPCIAFPSRTMPITIPFECDWGMFVVEVGMSQVV